MHTSEKHVLILDDCQITSIIAEHSWSEFLNEDEDNVHLFIFTSTGALSNKDKSCPNVRAYKEVPHPTTDGTLELWAYEMHQKYSFTHIYTKNEDLIIRAAHLRTLLKISTGLSADQVPAYREKVRMKEIAAQGGFPVPPFARLNAPADLIGFIEQYHYPVVVKPTLGCATAGLHLISNQNELETFLSETMFTCIDVNQRMDLVGELMVEGFMPGQMYHVNGIVIQGKIVHIWPFAYLHTCLDFSQHGSAYGNASISPADPRYERLCHAARRLLNILPQPKDSLVFHLELYENLDENRLPDDDFVLCEIAARAPGGSITHLIDLLSFSHTPKESFSRWDFRASISLPIPMLTDEERATEKQDVVTDLIVRRKEGKLMYIPRECPIPHLTYLPLADVNKPTVYEKYDVNGMNSACRFIARTKNADEGRALVEKGYQWFESAWIVTPVDEPCSVSLIKELHRYLHRKIFV